MNSWRIGQRVKVKNKVPGYGKVGTVEGYFSGYGQLGTVPPHRGTWVWVRLDTEDRLIPYDTEDLRKVKKFD